MDSSNVFRHVTEDTECLLVSTAKIRNLITTYDGMKGPLQGQPHFSAQHAHAGIAIAMQPAPLNYTDLLIQDIARQPRHVTKTETALRNHTQRPRAFKTHTVGHLCLDFRIMNIHMYAKSSISRDDAGASRISIRSFREHDSYEGSSGICTCTRT